MILLLIVFYYLISKNLSLITLGEKVADFSERSSRRLSSAVGAYWKHCKIMHLSAAIPGLDPGDIGGNSAGFADFCCQFLARDGGIGPLLHFRGKVHGERPAGL